MVHRPTLSRSSGSDANAPRSSTPTPPRATTFDDVAPHEPDLTPYDRQHAVTYLRLLDADAAGADWREVARIVLHLDPEADPDRADLAWRSHLARARWMSGSGYKALLGHRPG